MRVIWSSRGYRLTRKALDRVRPDIVHFHNTFPLLSPSALWAAHRSATPVVMTLHNFRPLCPAATFFRDGHISEECLGRLPLPAIRYGCYRNSRAATAPIALMNAIHRGLKTWERCVDALIVPSEFARTKYLVAGWNAGRLHVKHNTAPEPVQPRVEARNGFVCLSRLGPEKGVDILLRAWPLAFPGGGAELTIAGSGDDEAALRRAADGLEGVAFRGQVNRAQALELMATSRAVVIPSRCYEVFPRTVVEAYALGTPVVASRLGALADLVEHRRTGLLFSPASFSELAESLKALQSSRTLGGTLGSQARRAYEEKYSPLGTTKQLVAIYEQAISGRRN